MNVISKGSALGAAILAFAVTGADAHAVLAQREAPQGGSYRAVLQIMHGCKGSPTTGISVSLPDGVFSARPLVKAGWTITKTSGAYPHAYHAMHGTVTEGIRKIEWSGGRIPDDEFDEFTFTVRLADDLPIGSTVYFPVIQTCENGSASWTQTPVAGASKELDEPAPSVRIVAAAASRPDTAVVKAGTLSISQAWLRATGPGAPVAGGYLTVANGGTEPDRLLSASLPVAKTGGVHQMLQEGGVMKMRSVEGGLEIAPGQTVELKPGGFHLMFNDLTGALKEGETVTGTLTFAHAGTVSVPFAVGGAGARAPMADHEHMHMH